MENNPKTLQEEFFEQGFSTKLFSRSLKEVMLTHIEEIVRKVASPFSESKEAEKLSLEEIVQYVPDEIWAQKMNRAFRFFPKKLAHEIWHWSDVAIRKEFNKDRSAVNVVYTRERELNSQLKEEDLAIFWRCVRPGKPDAGRAHKDATFWDIEFNDSYDAKLPFKVDYIRDCIKIWIPLQGCVPTTTLQIIPYSHKMDIPTEIIQTEYGVRPTISESWLNQNEHTFMSPIQLSQGSCIIFDMNLVHRGPVHNNNKLRISAELNLFIN